MFSIYKIVNIVNNKMYIGQTARSIQCRFAEHLNEKYKSCTKLHNAMNKYGRRNFIVELLTITHDPNLADYWERYFIEKFNTINNGYNIRNGGKIIVTKSTDNMRKFGEKNHFYGKKHSFDSKVKISTALKGRVSPNKGSKTSEQQKEKISNSINDLLANGWRANVKITESLAKNIRQDYKEVKSSRKLAEKYKLSKTTIMKIVNFNSWIDGYKE